MPEGEKRLPTDGKVTFLVADFARTEEGGKLTIIGYFAGEEIVLSEGVPATFPISFVFILKDGVGDFSAEVELIDPAQKVIVRSPVGPVKKQRLRNASILFGINAFHASAFGTYSVAIYLDGVRYGREFRIIQPVA